MGEVGSSEIQRPETQTKDRLRAVQRQEILEKHFKEPLERDLLGALIPKDRPMQQTQTNANHLRQIANSLGKDTHTAFFGLAATSNNPAELQNILVNIINLKNIDRSFWNYEESENHFLRRKLPKYIDVSEEAEIQADPTLADPADKDLPELLLSRLRPDANAMRNDPRYALESFLYTISAENVPLEEKKRLLSDFYSAKTLMPASSDNKDRQKIYGSDSSFWRHVDGSWIYPKLAPALAPPRPRSRPDGTVKKTHRVRNIALAGTALGVLGVGAYEADQNVPARNIKEPTPVSAPLPDNTSHNTDILQPYTPQPPTEIPPTLTPEATKTPIPTLTPTSQPTEKLAPISTPTLEPTLAPTPAPTLEPTPTITPSPTETPTRTPVATRPPEATKVPVKSPIPTIEATKTPTPKPEEEKSKWTEQKWAPNETVPIQEWWNDMVAKGYISIDAIAQQYAGEQINNFLETANLVPNAVQYYKQGHGFINNCRDELDKLVRQGQGHIKITSNAYAQIPGGVECQIFTKGK